MTVADLQQADSECLSGLVSSATDVVELCRPGQLLLGRLKDAYSSAESLPEVVKALATIQGIFAAASLRRDATGDFRLSSPLVCSRPLYGVGSVHNLLRQTSQSVWATGSLQIGSLREIPELTAVVAPVSCFGPISETLGLIVGRDPQIVQLFVVILQLTVAEIDSWVGTTESHRIDTSAMLTVIRRIVAAGEPRAAYYALANELRSFLGCRQVGVGVCRARNGRCRLKAISGIQGFNQHAEVVTIMEAVMEEILIAHARHIPEIDGSAAPRPQTSAQRDLLQATDAARITCRPLRDQGGKLIGACLAVDDSDVDDGRVEQQLQHAAATIGTCLTIVRNMGSHPVQRLIRRLMNVDVVRRRVVVAFIVSTVLFAVIVPVPYKVPCTCVVQPVTRKYVAVPYDGVLEKVLVEPGDLITRGQVLAQMDIREIQWELAGLHADHSRSKKLLDANLAMRDTAAAQLAKLEMERLEVKIRLLENRANHLKIKSPIDGVVISGDPRKTEGARLTVGRNLFEIGPLDEMVVELAVPDEDVSHVAIGQSVEIWLEAYLGRTYHGTVVRIHPRSEMRDLENVFRADVPVDNSRQLLRPGMRGHARVRTESRALVWNLFHKAWQRLWFFWGW